MRITSKNEFEIEQRALDKAVASVTPLLEPMGFKIRKGMLLEYFADSDKVQIYMAHARTTVKTAVSRLPKTGVPSFSSPFGGAELHWILELFAPELNESDRYPKKARTDAEIAGELERQVSMLSRYAGELLKAEPEPWARLCEFMRDLGGLEQADDETDEHYISRLRERADEAWERKEFWRLNGIYMSLSYKHARLTLTDHYKWFQARRHTFLIG